MRALTLMLRWNLLRYASVEPAVWSRMSALYAFAERERFLSERFKVYRDMQGDSTVRREYLRALILSVSGIENLLPASQVVAERVIASVADFFLLHRRPAEGCHFGVDLLAARPPYRVGEGMSPTRTVRFFGPGDAGMMVDRLLQRTAETGVVPEELKLVGEFHPGTVHEVLQHLSRQWGAHPPSRSEMRQRVLSTLNVAHGLDLVLRAVSADQGSSELDEITEAWTVEDESSGGFGAALPARDGDWLAVGHARRIEADVAGVLERRRDPPAVHRPDRSTRGRRAGVGARRDRSRADADAGHRTCSTAARRAFTR